MAYRSPQPDLTRGAYHKKPASSEAYRALGGVARHSIANRAIVGHYAGVQDPDPLPSFFWFPSFSPFSEFPSALHQSAPRSQDSYWEKLNRGVSKPGGFPLFSGKVQIVSRTFSGLFLVGAVNRPRKRKRTNRENPEESRDKSGKSRKNRESPKKDKKGQKKEDKSRSGNLPAWNPPV